MPDITAIASRSMEMRPGDLIVTGPPEGVGAVERRQTLRGGIDGLGEMSLAISAV